MKENRLVLINHPLIKRDLTVLRDRNTGNHLFRTTLRRIATVMAFEVTRDLRLKRQPVHTPLEETTGFVLRDSIVIVPILRAGLGLVDVTDTPHYETVDVLRSFSRSMYTMRG